MAVENAGIRLTERLEKLPLLALGNADARVVYLPFQLHLAFQLFTQFDANIDVAGISKFDRIAQQIGDNLL